MGDLLDKKNQLLADIQLLDEKEKGGNLNEGRINGKNLQDQFRHVLFQKEIKWKQRSRNTWLEAGDRNTKFFHSIASARRRVNRVSAIVANGRLGEKNLI